MYKQTYYVQNYTIKREGVMRKEEKKKLKKLYLILAIIIFLIIFIDQLSKVLVVHYEEITLGSGKIILRQVDIPSSTYDETSRGVTIITNLVIVGIILGIIMPQQGYRRKYYIIAMTLLHSFVSGFRYMYLTGDLRNYASDYGEVVNYGWFSDNVFYEGRNAGFYWLMKVVSSITDGNFQIFLILLAIISEVVIAVLIFRYSPRPWLSYLVWNCMAFYVSSFSLIKQYLAMAVIMCAMICIFEKKWKGFILFTLIAGFIHMPALIFLPAYFIANRKLNMQTILGYVLFAGVIFLFRNQIVNWIANFYYEDESFELASTNKTYRIVVNVANNIC